MYKPKTKLGIMLVIIYLCKAHCTGQYVKNAFQYLCLRKLKENLHPKRKNWPFISKSEVRALDEGLIIMFLILIEILPFSIKLL